MNRLARFLQTVIFVSVTTLLILSVLDTNSIYFSSIDPYYGHDYYTTFFIESGNATHLSHRDSCAVEAAAVAQYPNKVLVYMIAADPTDLKEKNSWLEDFKNVEIRKVSPVDLFQNSKILDTYLSEEFQSGTNKFTHTSDLMRIVMLKKYGGLYLDLDLILTKPVLNIGSFMLKNYANGVLRFEKDTPLINLIYNTIEETKYNKGAYVGMGASVLHKSVSELCGMKDKGSFDEAGKKCNLTFVETEKFLPIPWHQWPNLFAQEVDFEKFRPKAMEAAFAIHNANHMTQNLVAYKNKSMLLTEIAKRYCPKAFALYPETF